MKLGIRSKLFWLSFGLIAAVLAVADALLLPELDRLLTERIRADLLVRLDLAEHDAATVPAPLDDMRAWDAVADALGRLSRARVTIVRRDGAVLGDSEVETARIARLENHAGRPEIAEALAKGHGESSRYSTTIQGRMLYVAVPLSRGGPVVGVVRLALPLVEIDRSIAALRRLLYVATALAIGLAAILSAIAAHLASRGVRALTAAANRMAGGDLATRVPSTGEDEFAELGRALDQLASSLSRSLSDLRAERDLLGGVLEGMREGVLLLDPEGRIALQNPAFREIFLVGAEAVGRPLLEVLRHAELKALIDRAVGSAEPVSGEIEVSGLKPRRLLVHASGAGSARGTLLVLVDVTDLRRLEALRREFVANASHELRTPVASARSALETLRSAVANDPQAAAEFLDIVERNVERLHRLIDDLLDLSRLESREFRLRPEPLALAPVVDAALALFRDRAREKRIGLGGGLPADLPAVRADRRALDQVLSNLLDNAVKYAPPGAEVRVRAAAEGALVRVSVEDTGPGIAPEHLPRLFERFYRVDAGRSRELGGTGLGLSIVKHLAEAMGGTVGVDSAPGRGTAFSFTLPRSGA